MDLCDRLGLAPTEEQEIILDRFYNEDSHIDLAGPHEQLITRAVALGALWRLLLNDDSQCYVISSSKAREHSFMNFMHDITTKIDPALASVIRWCGGYYMSVGGSQRHELRFMHNDPFKLQGIAGGIKTFIVLGAGGTDSDFETMRRSAESAFAGEPGVRFINIW